MKTPLHMLILRCLLAAGFVLAACSGFALVAAEAPPPDTGPHAPGASPESAVEENTATPPQPGPGAKTIGQAHPRLTLAELQTALAGLKSSRTIAGGMTPESWEQRNEIIAGVDPADIPAVLAGLDKFVRRGADRYNIRSLLLEHWGRTDPAAALAYAEKLENVYQRDSVLRSVFNIWVGADLPAARAWAARLPAGMLRQECFGTVVWILADTDPIAALDLCHELRGNWRRDVGLGSEDPTKQSLFSGDTTAINIFRKWAEKDPQASAAKAAEVLTGPARQRALMAIAETWAETAPLAALAWADSLTDGQTKRFILIVVTGQWAEVDPQAAATYVLPLPDGRARNDAIVAIAGGWASNDVTAALAWVRQLPDGPAKKQAFSRLRYRWATQDLPDMMAYAETLPAGTTKDELVQTAAQQLACQNPEEGLRWVRSQLTGSALNSTLQSMASQLTGENPAQAAAFVASMPAGAERDKLINRTASSLASRDPVAAIAWADKLPESRTLEQAWQAIAQHWAKDDFQAAADYVLKLPAGVRQSALVKQVATAWSQNDPQAALRWAQALPAGECQTLAVVAVVSSWSEEEPEAAAAWVLKCPEDGLRGLSISGVVSCWTRTDPAAACEWLKTLPEGKTRDQGVKAFMLNSFNYPDAVAAVNLISDANQRNLCIENLARQWLRSDPEAARKWLDTLDLPAGQIERWLKSLPQR
jgi:hypothetical protein